jgi:hypothetical protein
LHQQGARGVLFRIKFTSYGYVFAGKGTVEAFVPDLRHEGHTYKLRRAQVVGFGRFVSVVLT